MQQAELLITKDESLASERDLPQFDARVRQRYSPDFRRTYSTGAMGGFDGYHFTITFFRDNVKYSKEPGTTPTVDREIVSEVSLPPAALKEITRWLLQNVNEIEDRNGVIREPLLKTKSKQSEDPRNEARSFAAYS
jgi:hypothetical protein